MRFIRLRLVAFAVAAMACQGAVLSAAPLALCRGDLSADADLDECCRNLRPGQTCPMHHKTHGAPERRGPAWTCLCSPSDAVLASLIGVSGALPEPIRVLRPRPMVTVLDMASPAMLDHQELPQYPPPRA